MILKILGQPVKVKFEDDEQIEKKGIRKVARLKWARICLLIRQKS